MTTTAAPVAYATTIAAEDALIDALRDRLLQNPGNPPLFDWICRLLMARRISRGLAARQLSQLHDAVLER